MADAGSPAVTVAGAVVARVHDGSAVPATLSPRPYIDVFSLSGRSVTEALPGDHPHHLALSLALPDVDGITYWGGRTFTRGSGSELLDNHGRQSVSSTVQTDGELRQELAWIAPDGTVQLEESRRVRFSRIGNGASLQDGLLVQWRSLLTSRHGTSFGSPATNGRAGAFYGGVFWRTPFGSARVLSAAGEGADAAHGSTSPWLSISTPDVSVIAVAEAGMPWFIRTGDYAGFCPAVATEERRLIEAGGVLELALRVVVVDGAVDSDSASNWAELAREATR
ncbi:MAG: ccpA 5 [Glaciihabitans sp.]|nr:ccpA 5 [Glaciihabitans sp.]